MSSEGTQKTFLRERFKARCLQRAAVSREKAVRGKRFSGSANLFGEDLAMEDEEEDDETIMQDDVNPVPFNVSAVVDLVAALPPDYV